VGPHGVYWVDSTRGLILTVPPAGGTVVTLASGQSAARNLAVDEASVYWTRTDDDTVMKAPLSGGKPVTLVRSASVIAAMVVDATSVYWTEQPESAAQTSGMVMKMTPK